MALTKFKFLMALIKKQFHSFFVFIVCFVFLIDAAHAQLNKKTVNEFSNLQLFSENGDYRAGLFYSKKSEKFIAKKSGAQSTETLLLNSYKAFFNDKLDHTQDYEQALAKIKALYPLSQKDPTKSNLLKVYKVLSDLYFDKGLYAATDSIQQFLKQHERELLPFERLELTYYTELSNARKGYLNEVSKEIDGNLKKIQKVMEYDSVYHKKTNAIYFSVLSPEEQGRRLELYGKFLTLKAGVLIENGLSDSALVFIDRNYQALKKKIDPYRAIVAEIHYIKGSCYLKNDEFAAAEKEFKEALALAKLYYLGHARPVIEIEHALINSLLEQEKNEEAEYYNNDVDVKVTGYYGKNSFAYLKNSYTDIEYEVVLLNWDKAERMLKEVLASPLLPPLHENRLQALVELFQVQVHQKNYPAADSSINKAIALQQSLLGKEAPAVHALELKRAEFYTTRLDRFDEAKVIFSTHLGKSYLSHISPSNPEYLNAIIVGSTLYEYMDDYKMASQILTKGLELIGDYLGTENEEYAILLTRKADLEIDRGLFKEAEKNINTCITLFEKRKLNKYVKPYSMALETKAKLKIIEGDYQEADSLLGKATEYLKKVSTMDATDLFSMEEIGLLYIYTGKYVKAEKYLSRLLSEREAGYGKDHKNLITVLNYIGELNLALGNYSDADHYFDRASAIAERVFGTKSIAYANCLLYRKKMYSLLGDSEKAASVMEEVVKLYKKIYGEENIKLGMILHEYVLAKMEAHVYSKSKKDITKELDLVVAQSFKIIKNEFGEQSSAFAFALEDAAIYYIISNRYNLALESIQQAQSIWTKKLGEVNINNARLVMLSGKIYARQRAYDKSVNAFESAKYIYKDLFSDEHPGYVEALGECAKMYYMLNKREQAVKNIEECTEKSLAYIDKVFPVLSEKGKAAFWNKIKDNLEFYKLIAFTDTYHQKYPEMVGTVMNIEIKTRALLLNSLLKVKQQIMSSGDTMAIRIYQELLIQRENLALSYSLTSKQQAEMGVDVKSIENNIDELEKKLTEISYDFVKTSKKTVDYNWTNLRKYLEPGEVLLEVIPYREFLGQFTDSIRYAIVSLDAHSKSPSFIIIHNGNEIETKGLKHYRNCIKFAIDDEHSYTYFWKPIQPLIKPEYKKIVFVNDGVYNQINLETLRDPQGEYFINSKNISLISTSRDLFQRAAPRDTKKAKAILNTNVSLLGNPLYYINDSLDTKHRTIHQLPGSEEEVKILDSLFKRKNWKTTLVVNKELTEELIKNVQSPKVLHVSTHGFYMEKVNTPEGELVENEIDNPLLRSGLLFSNGGAVIRNASIGSINSKDGVLTAYEAMNMVLDNTDLVVLSACETGLGEVVHGEGVLGLQRSFQVAGAKTVIVSLFKVSDEVTQKLMVSFYENWFKSNDKYASFTLAKKTIMKDHPDPKYWGAFIIVGIE
jgi:CHAT domain-containing protein